MSKFVSLISTFKNGLVSPRLRGSLVQPEDKSACEKLENFIVTKTGAVIKRPGLQLESTETYTANIQHYTFNLLGVDYHFRFDPNVNFNAVDDAAVSAVKNSTYLKVYNTTISSATLENVKVFSKGRVLQNAISAWSYVGADITLTIGAHTIVAGDYVYVAGLLSTTNPANTDLAFITSVTATTISYTFTATPTGAATVNAATAFIYFADDLALWNGTPSTNGTMNSTSLETSLGYAPTIKQAKKISDRTVVFTTNYFSFLVTIFDYSTPSGSNTLRKFVMYPYFVSGNMLQNTLGRAFGHAVACPIPPSNFPFNSINTNTAIQITPVVNVTGTGVAVGAPTAGVICKSNNYYLYTLTFPLSAIYINGVEINMTGRFVSMPSIDATKDVVFFITSSGFLGQYNAILVVGRDAATTLPLASQFKISAWGNFNSPRVVGEAYGRLMYGNTALEPSKWWASAAHPDNILYRQGFMTTNLLQDASSDFSGINYAGVSIASISTPTSRTAISDIYRFGFNDSAPSGGAIGWITSRRNIHMGTSKGECQITPPGGNYNSASYQQIRVGTVNSTVHQIAEGDRKVFYLANNNQEIRYISTEDKDYDSLDSLLSTALDGLDLFFTRIEWVEEIHALFCFTTTSRIFILSIHTDTQIKAFSELVTTKTLLDFAGLRVFIKDDTNTLNCLLNSDLSVGGIYTAAKPMHGDLYVVSIGSYPSFVQFYSTTVYIVIQTIAGLTTRYTFNVPSGAFSDTLLPVLPADIAATSAVYIYRDLMTAKLLTLPLHEGANLGSSVGDIQRIDRVSVLVDKSGAFKYASETTATLVDSEGLTSPVLDSKIVTIDFPQSPDRDQHVYIESSDVTPLNISGISIRGVSYSGE